MYQIQRRHWEMKLCILILGIYNNHLPTVCVVVPNHLLPRQQDTSQRQYWGVGCNALGRSPRGWSVAYPRTDPVLMAYSSLGTISISSTIKTHWRSFSSKCRIFDLSSANTSSRTPGANFVCKKIGGNVYVESLQWIENAAKEFTLPCIRHCVSAQMDAVGPVKAAGCNLFPQRQHKAERAWLIVAADHLEPLFGLLGRARIWPGLNTLWRCLLSAWLFPSAFFSFETTDLCLHILNPCLPQLLHIRRKLKKGEQLMIGNIEFTPFLFSLTD